MPPFRIHGPNAAPQSATMPEQYRRWLRVGAGIGAVLLTGATGLVAYEAYNHFRGFGADDPQASASGEPLRRSDTVGPTLTPNHPASSIPATLKPTHVPTSILPSSPKTPERATAPNIPGMPLLGAAAKHDSARELIASPSESIRALGRYEFQGGKLFDSTAGSYLLPATADQIGSRWTVGQPTALKQDVENGFRGALHVFEPGEINVARMASEQQVAVFRSYFEYLSRQGVTTETLGRVVVMPQILTGGWQGARIGDYAAVITSQVEAVRSAFPAAHVSTLVDIVELQASSDIVSQLASLRMGALDSLTVQALSIERPVQFHTDNSGRLVADVEVYIRPDLIKRAADSVKHRQSGGVPVTLITNIGEDRYTARQRLAIAEGISRVAAELRSSGVSLRDVVIRFDDTSSAGGTNFSFRYPEAADPDDAAGTLAALQKQLQKQGITLTGNAA